ncbi:MAG: hypothetical protein JKY98_04980 [Gammaproteobacteria bacterium]|nr:hypothetical protein [Gammaproteobacteria bacterium]
MSLLRAIVLLLALYPALGTGAEYVIPLDAETDVRVLVFPPQNSAEGPWPLAVIIPAGSGQEFIVRSQYWLGKELAARGWVIAVPIPRDNDAFFGDDTNLAKVIAELQTQPSIDAGKSLLLGVSRGGTSALAIAIRNPGSYFGVVAVPGRLKHTEPLPELKGLRVFLRIADRDYFRWHKQLPEMSQRLESAGAKVNAALISDTRHIFRIDWSELEPWLSSLK